MPTDFGRDISGLADITPTLLESTGLQLMREVAVRRQMTPNASLLSAPDERTTDLRQFISSEQPLQIGQIQIASEATAALQADPRILQATVEVTEWEPEANFMQLTEKILTAAGPFKLTLAVTRDNIEVIASS